MSTTQQAPVGERTMLLELCDEWLSPQVIEVAVAAEINGMPEVGQAMREGRTLAEALNQYLTPIRQPHDALLTDEEIDFLRIVEDILTPPTNGLLAEDAEILRGIINKIIRAIP